MKRTIALLIVSLVLLFQEYSFGQQPRFVVTPERKTNLRSCTAITTQSPWVEKTLSQPLELSDTNRSDLIFKAKYKVFENFFRNKSRDYNALIYAALAWHADRFIQIPVNEIYKKGKKFHIYLSRYRIQEAAILDIAKVLNEYFRAPTIVVYNPNFFKENPELGESIRSRLQAAIVNSRYQLDNVLTLDRMPPNLSVEGDENSVNYYDVLLKEIVKYLGSSAIFPKVAIVVRDFRELRPPAEQAGVYLYYAEVHFQVINLNTYTIIFDEYFQGTGGGMTIAEAQRNAIQDIIDKNTENIIKEMALTYFNYIINGRPVIIRVPYAVYNDDDNILDQFIENLEKNNIVVEDEYDEDDFVGLKVYTQSPSQSKFKRCLRAVVRATAGLNAKVRSKHDYIYLEPATSK